MIYSRIAAAAVTTGAILAIAASAHAATVYINDPALTVNSIGTIVVGSKYRMSSVNFDQSLDSGGGTQNTVGVPGGANFLGTNLGNVAQLNGVQYAFSLKHIVGQGFTYTMTSPSNATWTQAWGSFAPPLSPAPNQSAALLPAAAATGQTVGSLIAPGLPFNALHIEARAEIRSGFSYSPSVSFNNLTFTTPGLTQVGSLVTAYTLTPGSAPPNPNFPDPNSSFYSQWLVADTNLALENWTIAGNVILSVANPPAQDVGEFIRFDISGKQVAFAPPPAVPEPATWAMMIAGFGLVGSAMRRRAATPSAA